MRGAQIFGLAGVNPFYASCKKMFRLDRRDKQMLVLSNNDGRCIARSKDKVELKVK